MLFRNQETRNHTNQYLSNHSFEGLFPSRRHTFMDNFLSQRSTKKTTLVMAQISNWHWNYSALLLTLSNRGIWVNLNSKYQYILVWFVAATFFTHFFQLRVCRVGVQLNLPSLSAADKAIFSGVMSLAGVTKSDSNPKQIEARSLSLNGDTNANNNKPHPPDPLMDRR